RWLGVDVGGDHVRLDLVPVDARARARAVDGVEDREELPGLVAVPERGEGHYRPHGRMGVLSAVLPYARRVARDVAGIERRAVERRREEQDELLIAANEVLLDRGHRARGAGGIGGPRKHGPRLRDRIDTAFGVRGGAERRPVVEIGAPVPVAVPGLALQRGLERVRVLAPPRRAFVLAAHLGPASEFPERRVQEPPEPDALPAPFVTDAI